MLAVLHRRGLPTRVIVGCALATVGLMCLTTAASGIVTDDAATTAVLMVVTSMVTATLFPWGVGPQLVTGVFATAAILWNVQVVGRLDAAGTYLGVGIAVAFIASLYAAHAFELYRRERKRAEALLVEAQARQHHAELAHAARLATLGEMAAGLAHELNQPLAAIVSYARGCVRRLESGDTPTDAIIDVIEEISAQALRAGEVLRRIRDFVRSGEMRRERVDVNDVVREAVRFAELEARQRGVTMPLALAPVRLPVDVDRVQIEQVILNLVRNGFDAMGGQPPDASRLAIATAPTGRGTVEVSVADTGNGIPAEIADRLFDPFFSTKSDGLGLGLSISRSIVEAHGGRLWATANPGRGATFRFTLPVAASEGVDAAA
jgi:C4-dicarboxylate-specific signal transduction histidine kinase